MGSSKEITTKNVDPGFEDPNSSQKKHGQDKVDTQARLSYEANNGSQKATTGEKQPQNPYLELKGISPEELSKLSPEECYQRELRAYTRALDKANKTINYDALHKDMQGLIDKLVQIEQNKTPATAKEQENLKRMIGYAASLDVSPDYFRFRLAWLEKQRADRLYEDFLTPGSKEFMNGGVIKDVFSHRAKAESLLEETEKGSHAYDPKILSFLQKNYSQDLYMPYYVRGLVDSQRALYSAEKIFRETELGLCSYIAGVGLARSIVASGVWISETLGLAKLGTMAAPVLANISRFTAPVVSKIGQIPGMSKAIPVAKFVGGTFAPLGTASGATTAIVYANGKAMTEGRDAQPKDYIESLQWAPSAAITSTSHHVIKSVTGKILENNVREVEKKVATSIVGGKLVAKGIEETADQAALKSFDALKAKADEIFVQPIKNACKSVADTIAHRDEIAMDITKHLQDSAKDMNWLKANDSFKYAEGYLDDLAKMHKAELANLKQMGESSSNELNFLTEQMRLVRKQIDDARAAWLMGSGVSNGISLSAPLYLADRKAGMADDRNNAVSEISRQAIANQTDNLSFFPMLRIGSGMGLVTRGMAATVVPKVMVQGDMEHRLGKDLPGITKEQSDALSDQAVFLSQGINNGRSERQFPALLGFYAPNFVSKIAPLKFALPAARFYSNSILPVTIYAMPVLTHLEKYEAQTNNYRQYVGLKFQYTDGFGTFSMTRPIGSESLVPDSMLTDSQKEALAKDKEAQEQALAKVKAEAAAKQSQKSSPIR